MLIIIAKHLYSTASTFKYPDFLGALNLAKIKSLKSGTTFLEWIRPNVMVLISYKTGAIPRFHLHTVTAFNEVFKLFYSRGLSITNWYIRLYHPSSIYNPESRAMTFVMWFEPDSLDFDMRAFDLELERLFAAKIIHRLTD